MTIEDDIFDLWHRIDRRMKWQLAGIWLEMEEGKLEKLEEEVIELEQEVLKELRAIHDSKDEVTLKHHMKRLLKLLHHVKPTLGWQKDLQEEISEIIQEAKVAREAYQRVNFIMDRRRKARNIASREEPQKPPIVESAGISLDNAFSILCNIIESNRNLIKFGVFSRGNVTGDGRADGGRDSFYYDPQKKKVVRREGWSGGVLPDQVDTRAPDNPSVWEKRLFRFLYDTEIVIGVKQEILGHRGSQVVSDDRGGNFYCVGISITYKGIDYDAHSEGRLMLFVDSLFKTQPLQFMELIDRLADRYIPFYNAGIKELEAEWRRATGR